MDYSEKINSSVLHISNSWEDVEVLIEGIGSVKDKRILSIAGAGDNLFSLCSLEPESIYAVDENPAQLYLIDLKKVAMQELEHSDCVEFLGYRDCFVRLLIYNSISEFLEPDSKIYWDNHLSKIDQGIVHAGKFEHYFQLFCNRVLPFIHSEKMVLDLFKEKSEEEQIEFYNTHWNSRLWRMFFKLFFSRRMLANNDKTIVLPNELEISNYLFERTSEYLKSTDCQHDMMLQYMLTNEFGDLLPHYLREENFQNVKANLDKIHTIHGTFQNTISEHGKFDVIQFADLFEHVSKEKFDEYPNEIALGCNLGARIIYWNLLNKRQLSFVSESFKPMRTISENLTKKDKAFFYQTVVVEEFTV